MSERTAKAIVIVIAAGAVWGLVAAFPWLAYVIVGVLLTLGCQRISKWSGRWRGSGEPDEEPEEEDEDRDVAEALRYLGRGGSNVLLTQLQKEIGAPDTKAVRKLLKAAGIRVRSGVRTPAGNGPGVHHDDIPAPPPEAESGHGEGCCCRSGPTTPTPTTGLEEGPGEGLSVEAIGQAGTLVRDPADAVRRHRVQ